MDRYHDLASASFRGGMPPSLPSPRRRPPEVRHDGSSKGPLSVRVRNFDSGLSSFLAPASGTDGCHQVVDDDEHKDGDEAIEEDYYDDDYEQEGASD